MSNSYFKLVMVTCLILGFSVGVFAQFAGGSGTSGSPYQVSSIWGLWSVRSNLDKYFTQTANISLWVTNPANIRDYSADSTYAVGDVRRYQAADTKYYAYYCKQATTAGTAPTNTSYWVQMWETSKGWQPIGTESPSAPFSGVYNGDNKIVSNLYINRGSSATANNVYPTDGENNVGLFGFVQPGSSFNVEIKNVVLTNPNVTGRRATGSLVGKVLIPSGATKKSLITRCHAKPDGGSATVSGFGATGGLVGANNSNRKQQVPVIQYCWANVTVSATHPNNVTINPGDNGNPYNIKYGGVVGCNETGVTFDCYALGSVSGGDRVGGVAGCTIDGAIIRCYSATGTLTQGISSTAWEGGIGGLTGRVVGKLPPGLGGYQGSGSVQYSYYDNSVTITSAGGPVNTTGSTSTSNMTTVQSTYQNWDFASVWYWQSGFYPVFQGSAPSLYYYRSTSIGDWSDPDIWRTSPTIDGSYSVTPLIFPDFSNSMGIQINTSVNLDVDVSVDQTEVLASTGTLTVSSGKTLSVENGDGDYDFINSGTLTLTGNMHIEQGASFQNKGSFTLTGDLEITGTAVWTSGSSTVNDGSSIVFNGANTQDTGSNFPSSVYDLSVQNSYGLTITASPTVRGTLEVLDGSVTGMADIDGLTSPEVKFLSFPATNFNILGYSASTNTGQTNMRYIKRQWTVTGNINDASDANRVKTLQFYWTSDDDYGYTWGTKVPKVYYGTSIASPSSSSLATDPRWIKINYTFKQNAKASESFIIGLDPDQTLPVELSSFTAMYSLGNSVQLQWITQSETNLSGYRIYRGTEEALEAATMLDTFIEGSNTSQTQSYVYIDRELFEPGTYYYWLESLDFDGSNSFFGPAIVLFDPDGGGDTPPPLAKGLDSIYPNPFNPSTTIRYGLTESAPVRIDIYNLRGQLIRTIDRGRQGVGYHSYVWNGTAGSGQSLSSGVFLIRVSIDRETWTQKVLLLK